VDILSTIVELREASGILGASFGGGLGVFGGEGFGGSFADGSGWATFEGVCSGFVDCAFGAVMGGGVAAVGFGGGEAGVLETVG
jgi:hypothetical protein